VVGELDRSAISQEVGALAVIHEPAASYLMDFSWPTSGFGYFKSPACFCLSFIAALSTGNAIGLASSMGYFSGLF
jgi:hypothetical protein